MYIEEVCIDGFKSYAQRTVVPNFDPKFNAITGLNGTGKSNILDSICFVLGITNLSQVRAANLQELVYKSGQAGVTKATVSIVWNNTDKSKSPVSYEQYDSITVSRQIVIGGRNKYLINGRVAQPSQVQNLFHSVQLNVNNPHFLIMQGRITKVLNMKPIEILSMLEEAAGTRMYEVKKEGALKTLEKKQGKLDEIDTVLQNEVRPALENLRKERALYNVWQAGQSEVQRLKRLCVAHSFTMAEKTMTGAIDEVEELKQRLAEMSASAEALQAEIAQKAKDIAKLTEEKDKEMGQEVKKLQEQADDASKRLVKDTTNWTNKKELHDSEKESLKQLQMTIEETKRGVEERAAAMGAADADFAKAKARVEKVAEDLKALEQEQQGVLAGKSSGAEGERTFEQKLSDAKAGVQASGAEAQQAQLKIKHLDKELGSKRKLLAAKQKEASSMQKELENVLQAVAQCQARLDDLHFDENRVTELKSQQEQERGIVRDLKRRVNDLSAELSSLAFSFSDPERGFDRSRVKGMVAKLFTVNDPSAMTALEVAAGGKLFNVVVSDANTGKLVLDKGRLQRRVTIIPLDKIDGRKAPQHVQQAAAHVAGPEGARLALSLVGYEDELQNAMAFVFGNSFICRDYQTAEKVCYDRNIRSHTVSLEGETFNPAGTITGGSRPKTSKLQKLHELRLAEADLERHQNALTAIEAELATLAAGNAEYQRVKGELELKSHSLKLLQERSEKSESHQLAEAVAAMETDLTIAQDALVAARERQAALQAEATELEQKKADQGKEREARLQAIESSIKAAKKEHAAALKDLKSMEESVQQQAMEREAMHLEIAALQEQATAAQEQANKLEEQAAELEEKVAARKAEYEAAKGALDETKARIKECDAEISAQAKEQARLDRKLKDSNVEAKKLDHKVKRMEVDQKDSAKLVERLLKEEAWIASERQLFGKPGTDYDFEAIDIKEAKETYERKQAEQDSTGKKVNKKVTTMFDHAEAEYKALEEKKNIVEADKAKIRLVIDQLDEKKKEALRVTWHKVNRDFGSIFSTLLPGTTAKLEPPEGASFLDGLEVKVAFGGVWKQSLTELSGGQRSLLALSLILALLLFKPAPLYILDEVDAALDLSHTQNIGRMIKTHFPQSQFVVVSLKEGMFNNADVIFRTKFVDGVSAVTRTVPAKQREKEREHRPVPVTPARRQMLAA